MKLNVKIEDIPFGSNIQNVKVPDILRKRVPTGLDYFDDALGGKGFKRGDRHPKIEEGVSIFASSTILGNVSIGKNSIVAAGSLVLDDVPENTTVAGIPAKKD